MLLTTGYGIKILDADHESIASALKSLLERKGDGDSFAILETSEDTGDYIQTIVDGDDTFHVEYREQDKKKHYEADGVSLTTTIFLFQSYGEEDPSWRKAIAWVEVSETMQW